MAIQLRKRTIIRPFTVQYKGKGPMGKSNIPWHPNTLEVCRYYDYCDEMIVTGLDYTPINLIVALSGKFERIGIVTDENHQYIITKSPKK